MYNPKAVSEFQKVLQDSPEGTSQPQTDGKGSEVTKYDSAIEEAKQKLISIMGPDIDYEGIYHGAMQEAQNRQVPEDPLGTPGGVASNFAFAMGAPDKAPDILREKIERRQKLGDEKQNDISKLKESILHGSIQQEVTKGNFKTALKHSEALEELTRATKDKEREQDLDVWKRKQLQKTGDARSLLKQKINQVAAQFHLDEKMQMLMYGKGVDILEELLSKTDAFGDPIYDSPEKMKEALGSVFPSLLEFAKSGKSPKEEEKPVDTPAAPKSKLQAKYDEIKARKGKK